MEAAANLTGLHDFDFLDGKWRAHHRRPQGNELDHGFPADLVVPVSIIKTRFEGEL
jgi:hypothetical protein